MVAAGRRRAAAGVQWADLGGSVDVVVLVVVLVRNKSKINNAPFYCGCCDFYIMLFCTVAEVAPIRSAGGVLPAVGGCGCGWVVVGEVGGRDGKVYPPPPRYDDRTISGFSLQKFFFGFRMPMPV